MAVMMRPHLPISSSSTPAPETRDTRAVAELLLGVFQRDLQTYYPQSRFEAVGSSAGRFETKSRLPFQLIESRAGDEVEMFGLRYAIGPRCGGLFSDHDRRMIRAIGAVLSLRYHHLFEADRNPRLDIYRGGSEDHYIAAFIDPNSYLPHATRPSRIASTIQTLRTAALSTYENRRVSTGALVLGLDASMAGHPTPVDALSYDVELTSLKCLYRLCDGKRTLFLVDRVGRLAEIIDVEHWASDSSALQTPCAGAYASHARSTRVDGNVCLLLSPNQEIKLFADGVQAFAFAHGRWRILDPPTKYAAWTRAVKDERVARVLYQSALDLAESRQGGLLVVVNDPSEVVGRLIAPHDLLSDAPCDGPPLPLTPGDPLAKRALHYLARGRSVTTLDASVLEALGGLDGALVVDQAGRILAFGAILRHDANLLPATFAAEGARTTAAAVASRFGAVLKVSEDGVVSCFRNGERVWDL